ncbi:MAG: acyl-CoA thioesterase [Crocinitomicaceae bacterium]
MIDPFKVQIRFADIDVMGHVNNAVYLSYFEMARVHYFKQILGENWDWQNDGVLLVRNEVDYLVPIFLHDTPEIKINVEHIGSKSFTLNYEINVGNKLATRGKSTMVCFNNLEQRTQEIPEKMKLKLSEFLT